MHRVPLLAFLLLGTPVVAAQDAAPSPEEQLRGKLASPFLTHAPWLTD